MLFCKKIEGEGFELKPIFLRYQDVLFIGCDK